MNPREILEKLAAGELSVEEAQSRLSLAGISAIDGFARLDTDRHARKGVPEVVYAPGKTVGSADQRSATAMVEHTGRAIVSGLDEQHWPALE